jgi:YVTN family beta-propeller protein
VRGVLAGVLVTAVFCGFAASPASAAPHAKKHPGRGTIWVTNDGAGGNPVQVISGSGAVTDIEPFHNPQGIAFTPNGSLAYVTNAGSGDVSVVNTSTLMIATNIPLPGVTPSPGPIVMSPNGNTAYVLDNVNGYVDVISTATNSETAAISVNGNLDGLAITPSGSFVYVTFYHGGSADVAVIDTSSNQVVDYIPVGGAPQGIAITKSGATAYVANCANGAVCEINTATNTLLPTTIPVGGGGGLALSPRNNRLWVVATPNGQHMASIKLGKNKVTSIGGLNGPAGTGNVVFSSNSAGYVACQNSNLAEVRNGTVTYPFSLGGDSQLSSVAIEP